MKVTQKKFIAIVLVCLEMADDPGLSRWPSIITRVLTGERERQESQRRYEHRSSGWGDEIAG